MGGAYLNVVSCSEIACTPEEAHVVDRLIILSSELCLRQVGFRTTIGKQYVAKMFEGD